MRAIVASRTGGREAYNDLFKSVTDWPRPKRGQGQMLVKVQAVSLAPGDVRTLSGATSLVQKPKAGWPMVPCGDLSGIVEEADPDCDRFKVGDNVISRFHDTPEGGLAEYAVVSTALTGIKPAEMSWVDAAAVPASVVAALRIARKWVRDGDRVLVLGGSGGVGSHIVQMLKGNGASFVAATSHSHPDLLTHFGLDRVIDYSNESWYDIEEFQKDPLDLVIDLASPGEPGEAYERAKGILKTGWNGGRFVTLAGPSPLFTVQNVAQLMGLATRLMLGGLGPKIARWLPGYQWDTAGLASPIHEEEWSAVFKLVSSGQLQIITDPGGQFPFTAQGVCDAFSLQASRHAQGKVVVVIGGS